MLDKVVAAVTPMESDEKRREARSKALAAAGTNDWLSIILQHHEQIEAAFDTAKASRDLAGARRALKELALILTGHSNAEEAVIYPALAWCGEKGSASMGYTEQAAAKTQAGELEFMDPMSQEFAEKLEHLRGAVLHHMYEEESSRFLELKEKMPEARQAQLTQRFREEFERYVGSDASWNGAPRTASSASTATSASAGLRPTPGAAH
jgi:hemerythrin superfamily protein